MSRAHDRCCPAWRYLSTLRLVRVGIYIFGMLILQTFPAAMSNLMRAMVVKQGIKVNRDVGRGQLNA